jgi:hypothetical protein
MQPRTARVTKILVLAAFAAPASAQVFSTKLVAPGGGPGAQVGETAALSGDFAVLGAPFHDAVGANSGAAYVFRRVGGVSWASVQRLTPHDLAPGDYFGDAVAVSGNTVLVGSPFDDDLSDASGSAYVFEWNGSSWVQAQKLLASDGSALDLFGSAVAIGGDLAVVGAYEDDDPYFGAGSAYVFRRTAGTWIETAKLKASDSAVDDRFGWAVATDGVRVIVGARDHDAGGEDGGAAYIYEEWSGQWLQRKLTANDGAAFHSFGTSVAIQGNRALVGSVRATGSASFSGAAYVFDRLPSGTWIQTAKLSAPGQLPNDQFGWSVALDGDRAIVGARLHDAPGALDSGAAYFFERDNSGTWKFISKFTSPVPAAGNTFGSGVALDGDTALVSSRLDDNSEGVNAGAAETFSFPMWHGAPSAISLASGGEHRLRLDRAVTEQWNVYIVLGSAAGTSPGGSYDGLHVPLEVDSYFMASLTQPNVGPFGDTLGNLDGNGDAIARIQLPAGLNPALAGLTLHHAAIVFEVGTAKAIAVTPPVPLLLTP